jgi:asparagine N-glycosylation enzyme membrane subunit Stt3
LTLLHIRFEYYLVVYIGIGGAYVITWFKKVTAQSLLALSFIFFGIVFVLSLYSSQSRQDGQFAHAHFFMAEWINENLPPSGIEESGAYKDNPQPLYGILANWENGYIYTHIGKRAFVTNPGHCNFKIPSEFFMLTDEDDAFEYLKARNIEYVLVDTPNYSRYYYHRTQVNENNLPSLLSVVADNNQFQVVEGEYFETIMSRLYNFDGLGHTSEKSIVVRDNKLFTFDSFARAKEDINKNGGEIYGSDFRNAPIDFPPLEHFELIHSEGEWENGVKLFKVVE